MTIMRPGPTRGAIVITTRPRPNRIRRSRWSAYAVGLSQHERDLTLKRLAKLYPRVEIAVGFVSSKNDSSWMISVLHGDLERVEAKMAKHRSSPTFHRLVPGTSVQLLSRPTKMPGMSWSLPAGRSCPFMVIGHNSICGVCYAMKGRYTSQAVMEAQAARFAWVHECLKTPDGTRDFIDTMVEAIGGAGYRYMRVHDSGDLFSPAYTRAWAAICAALPRIHFWFPTRSWRAPWVDVIRDELAVLPNVAVRPSALHFNARPPEVEGLAAGTTARAQGFTCPAPFQGNACRRCRTCWDKPAVEVSYHAH